MASLSRHDRAIKYAKQLKNASNKEEEGKKILNDLELTVWTKNERLATIEEIKSVIQRGGRSDDEGMIVEAGDNSGILDVLDMLESKVQ